MGKRELSLKEIQNIELDILEYIHNVCEEHGIKYFLDYGTLLGAIRHKEFIPWDDDTDISLARDEYERLYEVLEKTDHPHYKVISFHNCKEYPYPYYRVYDARTYREHNVRYKNLQLGTCVDVFPYDGLVQEKGAQRRVLSYRKKGKLSAYTFQGVKNKKYMWKNIPRYLGVLLFKCSNPYIWNRKMEELAKTFPLKDAQYCGSICAPMYHKSPILKPEWLYDTIEAEYCGKVFKIPRHYHEFLVDSFGDDYMQLPPVEERVPGNDKNYIID